MVKNANTISLDPDSKETLDRLITVLDAIQRHPALSCDGCGVTIIRPAGTIETASRCWAAGDLCAFTKECMGSLRAFDGVWIGLGRHCVS